MLVTSLKAFTKTANGGADAGVRDGMDKSIDLITDRAWADLKAVAEYRSELAVQQEAMSEEVLEYERISRMLKHFSNPFVGTGWDNKVVEAIKTRNTWETADYYQSMPFSMGWGAGNGKKN